MGVPEGEGGTGAKELVLLVKGSRKKGHFSCFIRRHIYALGGTNMYAILSEGGWGGFRFFGS